MNRKHNFQVRIHAIAFLWLNFFSFSLSFVRGRHHWMIFAEWQRQLRCEEIRNTTSHWWNVRCGNNKKKKKWMEYKWINNFSIASFTASDLNTTWTGTHTYTFTVYSSNILYSLHNSRKHSEHWTLGMHWRWIEVKRTVEWMIEQQATRQETIFS